jgi:acylaminoacyl-peptidase
MIKSLRLAASAVALTVALAGAAHAQGLQASPQAAPQKPHVFTAKEMASLDRLSDPRVSPDGRYVLYSVRTLD